MEEHFAQAFAGRTVREAFEVKSSKTYRAIRITLCLRQRLNHEF
jgi:hypothetical protein